MEARDKITEKMQEAARNAESQPFSGMERVWERITERLDEKPEKKIVPFLNYRRIAAAVAVLVLLGLGTGYLLMDTNDTRIVAKVSTGKTESSKGNNDIANLPDAKETGSMQSNHSAIRPGTDVTLAKRVREHHRDAVGSATGVNVRAKSASAFEPFRIVEGTLVDEGGEAVPGASVAIKGTQNGTITDIDGRYKLRVDTNAIDLAIRALGYTDTIIAVAGTYSSGITVLSPAMNQLDEVSITMPYGPPVTKEKYVGAADAVPSRSSSVTKSIESAAPGVQVTKGRFRFNKEHKPNKDNTEGYVVNYSGSSDKAYQSGYNSSSELAKTLQKSGVQVTTGSGQPGSGASIQIRGRGSLSQSSKPLIVLDGAPFDGNITDINPLDVEKMTILKDNMATSLYGARGSSGVILITTHKGAEKMRLKRKRKKWYDFRTWFSHNGTSASSLPEASSVASIPPSELTGEDYDSFVENPFESPRQAPLSTFSIDVDNAAYANVRRFINGGQHVPKDAVRIEEMINYFHYQYPQPQQDKPFSINTEYNTAPWNPQHQLLKIGLQGRIIQDEHLPASNLVFLIDVSGSMSDANKLPLLKKSLELLVSKLRKEDKVSIVVYAGSAGMVLPPTSGKKKAEILEALNRLQAGGSTAGGAGIELAYKIAEEQFIKGGNNRVILATDGDFNIGASSNADMQALIEEKRKSNVFLTCLGYGMGNYKDSKMEVLADKGNGNYAYIDNIGEANRFLIREFTGSMYAIAKDVKIQIEFNPKYVQAYRLIGYENRKLNTEDFADDKVDAGELGSGHTVTALYEIIPAGVKDVFSNALPDLKYTKSNVDTARYSNELATIKFRSKKPDSDKSTEMVTVVDYKPEALSAASADFKLAAAVAWFGLKLRDSKYIANKDKNAILKLAKQSVVNDEGGYKAEFVRLVETAP